MGVNLVNNQATNYSLYYNILDYFKEIMSNHPSIAQVSQGDIFEIDDTPKSRQDGKPEKDGYERIHLYHRKGTFLEIHPDGTQVTKIVGDKHEIVVGEKERNPLQTLLLDKMTKDIDHLEFENNIHIHILNNRNPF
mgnify:CR=1 FL=1